MIFQNTSAGRWPGHFTPDAALVGRTAERATLRQLLQDARTGRSGVLVVGGEPGVGKTALLDHAASEADNYRIVRICGVESETDLPYSGLHLLRSLLVDRLAHLEPAARAALDFGLPESGTPDRFLVGLATLALLSSTASRQPLLCVVDDAQWLDRSSARVLAFVARRLETAPVALLIAHRGSPDLGEFEGLPVLPVDSLSHAEAHGLLQAVLPGRVDDAVAERLIAETRGNPGRLLDSVRGASPTELAGGYGVAAPSGLSPQIERDLVERVSRLRPEGQRLLLAAAAEPIGDPALLWRAAAQLEVPVAAAKQVESEGLLSLGTRVTFGDPRWRSLVYALASSKQRRRVHRALAAATDGAFDPDRRVWHLAHAVEGPDEAIGEDLERWAANAGTRGGFAAQAAFLNRAALLTTDPELRTRRALAAAAAAYEAGASDTAVRLLASAELGPLDEPRRARMQWLRARMAFATTRGRDAAQLLLRAAQRLEAGEPALASQARLDTFCAAILAGRFSRNCLDELAQQAADSSGASLSRIVDLLLDGLVARFSEGYAIGVERLRLALKAIRCGSDDDVATRWLWLACLMAADLWDEDSWVTLTARDVQRARGTGALTDLPLALTHRALAEISGGDFANAAALIDEAKTTTDVTDRPQLAAASLVLAGWSGREDRALHLIEAAGRDADARGEGFTVTTAKFATAVLYNGLGRYGEALAAARQASECDEPGLLGWSLAELIEAAVRTGETGTAGHALERLAERTRLSGSDWALGIEARSRALLCDGPDAEDLYAEAIERLSRSRMKTDLARAQLLYGEWLRRRGRRVDARVRLRAAHQLFADMGAAAFAERAQRELLATGERVRSRVPETRRQLTPQETRIAQMARDGLTNPQIGARLSVSARTVEYHLHKVFAKLNISSRMELHLVLADAASHR